MNRKKKKITSFLVLNSMILGMMMNPLNTDAQISSIHPVTYGTSWNYEYTGDKKTFKVPRTGRYFIEAYGAQGQSYNGKGGGLGGSAEGIMNLNTGTNLTVNVGGQNGYNGGGSGSATGGGASDVRLQGYSSTIVTGAGGGGGENGGDANVYQNSNSSKGGISVGAGAGGDGTNGGGGGRSPDSILPTGDGSSYSISTGFSGYGGFSFVDSTLTYTNKYSGLRSGDGLVKITEVFTPPELTITTDSSEINDTPFLVGENLTISGSIRDFDNKGDIMKVMYQIDDKTPVMAFSSVPSKSFKSFTIKPLLTKDLEKGYHKLHVWATDETGQIEVGSEEYYNFEIKASPSVLVTNNKTKNQLDISWTSGIQPYDVRYNVYRMREGDESTLSQIFTDTSETSTTLSSIFDNTPPDGVTNVAVQKIGASNYLQFSEATKKGTNFSYYVEAIRQTDGKKFLSDKATGEVKAKISGYSYVVDDKPTTEPDKTIDTNALSTLIDVSKFEYDQEYYVHIKTIDSNNKESKTVHQKILTGKPILDVSLSEAGWTKNDVTITIKASSLSSKIERIELPDGTQVSGDTLSYTVSKNGLYPFVAYDETGAISVKVVDINKIDKLNPTIELVTPTDWQTQDIGITIKATP